MKWGPDSSVTNTCQGKGLSLRKKKKKEGGVKVEKDQLTQRPGGWYEALNGVQMKGRGCLFRVEN